MNDIERQAYLAVRHLADAVVYVFDLTESYPMRLQKKLYGRVESLGKPVVVYASKADLVRDTEAISDLGPLHDIASLRKKLSVLAEEAVSKH
jgi:nucleolar GTP-binding protein